MNSPTEEIKSRVDIVDLVQGYIRLEKAGANFRAVCPFHSEKTPSFFVNPARQIWHCFGGCSIGGDIFSFVMKIDGVEFPEALEILARRAGIELKREDPRFAYERKKLYEVSEASAKYFQEKFQENSAVKKYMKERGVTDETIENFRVGFAPDGWRNLLEHLIGRGFKAEDIEKSGLAIKREQDSRFKMQDASRYYDRFRNRIMFPITDGNGRVIGFGGRIFEETRDKGQETSIDNSMSHVSNEHVAKYINTPQTLIYDKSRVLYAFDKAKQEIRKKNECILVEGYMDAIMSHQAGFSNTIAVSGTALTGHQLRMLKRLTNVLVSSFDADQAGEMATSRSLDLAGAYEFERKVAVIPKELGKDPADIVLKDPELWKKIVVSAKNVVEFYFERALRKFDQKIPLGKKEIARAVLPQLTHIDNEIERSHWMRKLSQALEVSEQSIWQEFVKAQNDADLTQTHAEKSSRLSASSPRESGAGARTRKQDLEEKLLGMLLLHPQKLSLIEIGHLESFNFSHEKAVAAYSHIIGKEQGSRPLDGAYHDHLKFKTEVFLEGIDDVDKELKICFNEFLRELIKEKLGTLSQKIIAAEKEKSQEILAGLMLEFQALSNKFHSLN
ncbi:MAG: DNA primase [Candidatus Sungbacteria bacterium RIFCSPHIGHO2_02_FULL_41_12b]|nr:MAG: DNA primase [Candidatus Sungbacteria bacterium RIFCSPHIGHO2_02_FULL_41_12b]